MAITPIELPDPFPCNAKVFTLHHQQQITPSGSGFVQTIERSTPAWFAQYTSPPLVNGGTYGLMLAFLMKLEGSMNTFLAYDPRRPMPQAYITQSVSSNPWTAAGFANPRITAQDYANSTITLDRLAAGAIISPGDYISIKVGNIWHLMRLTEGATADGTGIVTLGVKPRPVFTVAAATEIRYRRACCAMKLLSDYEEEDEVSSAPIFSFTATQFVDRT